MVGTTKHSKKVVGTVKHSIIASKRESKREQEGSKTQQGGRKGDYLGTPKNSITYYYPSLTIGSKREQGGARGSKRE